MCVAVCVAVCVIVCVVICVVVCDVTLLLPHTVFMLQSIFVLQCVLPHAMQCVL